MVSILSEPPVGFTPKFQVAACYMQHDGKFLLLLRNDDKPEGNKWGMPGGKVDKHETHAAAIAREVAEETGVLLNEDRFVFAHTAYVRYPEYDFVFHLYSSDFAAVPALALNEAEHKAAIWATPEEALNMTLVAGNETLVRMFYNL